LHLVAAVAQHAGQQLAHQRRIVDNQDLLDGRYSRLEVVDSMAARINATLRRP
jgi:hypothetical protein